MRRNEFAQAAAFWQAIYVFLSIRMPTKFQYYLLIHLIILPCISASVNKLLISIEYFSFFVYIAFDDNIL